VLAVGRSSPAELARLETLDPSERADAELRARSLRYVAATRARDELVVVSRL
jgi:superfamily I DNA/RNA helicase